MGTRNVLLSFAGFHDPYADTTVQNQKDAGPILTVMAAGSYDHVVLFDTPNTTERTAATAAVVRQLYPEVQTTVKSLPLSDPTDHLEILKQLRRVLSREDVLASGAALHISVSSGTPAMHACWMLLAASGEFPARILQSRPATFVSDRTERVTELDLNDPSFPHIRRPVAVPEEGGGTFPNIAGVRQRLQIVGGERCFVRALEKAGNLARYGVNVLLLGETGSGKELFAKLIHTLGGRPADRLLTLNCAAYPETLIESQLFGHTKGAFTGATRDQKGSFELADGGTLFLDELAEMSPACQSKLLRALEYGEIEPLGSGRPRKVDVRVVAATNRDIAKAVKEGAFREDLYYRFKGVVRIPPLRERRRDIPLIAQHALDVWNTLHGEQKRLSVEALARLTSQHWPGNARELIRVVEYSAMMLRGKVVRPENLQFDEVLAQAAADVLPEPYEGFDINAYCSQVRQRLIDRALEAVKDNRTAASKLLGISPQAVSQYCRTRDSKE